MLPYCSTTEELSQYYQMFTARFMSELYGAAAVEAYAGDPESAMFNCFFLQNVARFTIDGNEISGVDAEGAVPPQLSLSEGRARDLLRHGAAERAAHL